ncbi:MAG TPA: hypothetical protein VMH02_10960 [Verrucomicrobiae bacterium]|nr:hypothetical protein [Verrucomicrobiae bacterium]
MNATTLRAEATLDDTDRGAVEEAVRVRGGTIRWRSSPRVGRTYGLAELPGNGEPIRAILGERIGVREGAIIALAVFPSVAEALPALLEALAGEGRPAGVLACEPCEGGVVVEWDPAVTPAHLVLALIDVELARFASGRTVELLTPLSVGLAAAVAAGGLATPEVAPERVLELLIERAGRRV